MKRFSFTQEALDALPIPERLTFYYDDKERGLALGILPSGRKTFYLYRRVKGKPKQIKIGVYPAMKIGAARLKAKEMNLEAEHGGDPSEARKKARDATTFDDLYRWWLEAHSKARNKTSKQDERRYDAYLQGLGKKRLTDIDKATIRDLYHRIAKDSGEATANRCLTQIQSVYTQAMYHDRFEGVNPSVGIRRFTETARDRRLTAEEMPRFMQAVASEPDDDIRHAVLLLLYTGQRRGNVLAMRWDQLDLTHRIWRIPETKNGRPHVVPLDDGEIAILNERKTTAAGPWVFPGRTGGATGHLVEIKKSWSNLLDRAGLRESDFRIHDLRRTLASWMVDTGASLHVVGDALAHQSTQTTAGYARLALDPVREAKRRALAAIKQASGAAEAD